MLDPIADMLTRLRNAQRAGHATVKIPASRLKLAIAEILEKRGFILRVEKVEEASRPFLLITLRYVEQGPTRRVSAIRNIRRVSRQGQRIYVRHEDIRKVKNGYGLAVISTSKGVMAGEEAYRQGLGGEYLCEVW